MAASVLPIVASRAGVTAFAFAFPLFLCNRERLLAERRAAQGRSDTGRGSGSGVA